LAINHNFSMKSWLTSDSRNFRCHSSQSKRDSVSWLSSWEINGTLDRSREKPVRERRAR